jgi:hypothetical protein
VSSSWSGSSSSSCMTEKLDRRLVKCCDASDVYGGRSLGQYLIESKFLVIVGFSMLDKHQHVKIRFGQLF